MRHRTDGVARKADQVSDAELAIAVENLVVDGGVLSVDELLAAVARLYGWSARRSADFDARLTGLLADLVAGGTCCSSPTGFPPRTGCRRPSSSRAMSPPIATPVTPPATDLPFRPGRLALRGAAGLSPVHVEPSGRAPTTLLWKGVFGVAAA